ncbi:MAG: septum site-determining protein MinC [Xanthomonadales bacterium]|uniref:septum site-determining protein MinC n=1 Tax=Dokdonella sp. TaxID=2291710 RepID=UPI002C647672|nr:septum site-determining protein MinC [Xanthomonadales bacterium]HQV72219.1 septum site-determining protein MinC [Dokdonella sp.]MBK7013211.1 septum site-determining protein MinC [Xanthomonadales bacterium]MBK7211637.1 septum site-determining protein MinC [Xanthomonadales bacterium]MBL0221200.1 septum site-determining protein MinC [Xanthomonadales bacterium]
MSESAKSIEPASELKFGQVGVANLRLKRLHADAMSAELQAKVNSAPQLFLRTPVILDLSHLPGLPTADEVRGLFGRIRAAGMLPVGLSYGTTENEELARALDLPLFAKFRAAFERAGEPMVTPPSTSAAEPTPVPVDTPTPVPASHARASGLHQDSPVRSGQQVYARGSDLVVTKLVANGAEVIADGSIHIYGALRGRALAGAQGDESARIYCQEFHAELVSIAGRYRVFEDLPQDLRGKPVQAWLEGEKLLLARLG